MNIIDVTDFTTVVAATSYSYTNPINLNRSKYAGLPVLVKCDVKSGESTASFDVNALWCEQSGGTYAAFITGSGSSKVIVAGTSGALYAAGSYVVPLTIVPHSGTTELFKATGFLKLGRKSTGGDFNVRVNLIV